MAQRGAATHFTHEVGLSTWRRGRNVKDCDSDGVGVTEPYQSKAGTKYSNADRTYSLELYRSGVATERLNRRTSSMLRTIAERQQLYRGPVGLHNRKTFTHVAETSGENGNLDYPDTKQNQSWKRTNVSFLKTATTIQTIIPAVLFPAIIRMHGNRVSKIHSRRMVITGMC